jgi:hypothetical protein
MSETLMALKQLTVLILVTEIFVSLVMHKEKQRQEGEGL